MTALPDHKGYGPVREISARKAAYLTGWANGLPVRLYPGAAPLMR